MSILKKYKRNEDWLELTVLIRNASVRCLIPDAVISLKLTWSSINVYGISESECIAKQTQMNDYVVVS